MELICPSLPQVGIQQHRGKIILCIAGGGVQAGKEEESPV